MITPQQFRADFPEFTSTSTYPNSGIQFYLDFAYRMINPDRFLSQTDIGAELFAAHFIALEAKNLLEANNGGIPGMNTGGPVSSKSVDKVSISYDTGAGTEEGAGHWNLTQYGIRFRSLVRIFGAGPGILNGGFSPSGSFGTAWSGPDVTPGFSNFSS